MNNLEKEFIPYEQALALKELGFDEPCFAFFQIEYVESEPIMVDDDHEYRITWCRTCKNSEIPQHYTSAPTYSQAFRFFREKYKIRFIIQSSMSDLGEYFKVIFPNGEQRNVSYNTYEEAEIAVIVKLIEICRGTS